MFILLCDTDMKATYNRDDDELNSQDAHPIKVLPWVCSLHDVLFVQLKVDSHTMNIPSDTAVTDLQSLKDVLMAEIGVIKQHLSKLDERVAAIEEKLAKSQ